MNSALSQSEPFVPKPQRRGLHRTDPVNLLVFLIPCAQFIHVSVIGVLTGSDVMFLITFFFLVFRGKIKVSTPVGKKFVVLCSLWLLSQCVTDFVRHSAFTDYARGWSNIGMTLVNFLVLYTLLYGRPRRFVIYGWGLVVGSALTFILNPSDIALYDPWKFGLSYPVTLALLLIASRRDCRRHWPITLSVIAGLLNLTLAARNAGGECLAAALYVVVTRFFRKRGVGRTKLSTSSVALLTVSIFIGAVGILWSYQYAARAGILGENARDKYEEEASGKYGVIVGARPELLASIPAIYDSPILGHGSWARDPTYLMGEQQALALLGYKTALELSPEELQDGRIPAHSYIFGAWIDGGFLGALFWGWVWIMTVKTLVKIYPPNIVLPPAVAYFAFLLLWDLLFSPYSREIRAMVPYYIVILMGYRSIAPQHAAEVVTGPSRKRLKTA